MLDDIWQLSVQDSDNDEMTEYFKLYT